MPQSYKNKVQYILTAPTSLEMLKNSDFVKIAEILGIVNVHEIGDRRL